MVVHWISYLPIPMTLCPPRSVKTGERGSAKGFFPDDHTLSDSSEALSRSRYPHGPVAGGCRSFCFWGGRQDRSGLLGDLEEG